MKRSNFVCGLGTSGVLHVGLLYLLLVRMPGGTPPAPVPPPQTPVKITQKQTPADPPAAAQPAEELDVSKESLEQVATPPPRKMPDPIELPPAEPARSNPTEATRLAETPPLPAPARPTPTPARPSPVQAPAVSEAAQPELVQRLSPQTMPLATPQPPVEQKPAETERAEATPASQTADEEQPGHPGSSTGDGDYVPPLRVHWRDSGELIAVARSLGLRLAAVNRSGAIIGEVAVTSTPGLKEWSRLPAGYSNRVRMLSPSIFKGALDGDGVHEIWVFVPAHQDRMMISIQRSAVVRRGGQMEDVRSVDGRFVKSANGTYRLDVTNIRWRDGRRPRG